MRRKGDRNDKGAIGLLDEAVHLVRLAPAGALAGYYLGSMPFVLAALYFWADMSRSPFASGHVAGAALGLAGLFVWMKGWQSFYVRRLLGKISGGVVSAEEAGDGASSPPGGGSTGRGGRLRAALRLAAVQAAFQPWGLVALVPAAMLLLRSRLGFMCLALVFFWPGAQGYAFFQHVLLFGDGTGSLRTAARRAWRLARLRRRENLTGLVILAGLGLIVFVNLAQATLLAPVLLKKLLGVETVFTRGGFRPANSTFLAIMVAGTYLLVDPLVKAFYVLRGFYGESLRTGQDLRAELRRLLAPSAAGGCLLALVLAASAGRAQAQPPPPAGADSAAAGTISPQRLDASIREVISRREYAWRMPREEYPAQRGPARRFLDSLRRDLRESLAGTRRWLKEKLDKWFGRRNEAAGENGHSSGPPPVSTSRWPGVVRTVVYCLLGVAAAALAVLGWLTLRARRASPAETAAEPAGAVPDLTDESTTGEELSQAGWMELAERMLARGDRRLALRAMFLASLALLAERGLISLARHKSNRDYLLELRRRGPGRGQLLASFEQNVGFFEEVWYGMHDVTDRIAELFAGNQTRLRAAVGADAPAEP